MMDIDLLFGGIGALSASVSIISAIFSYRSKRKAEDIAINNEKIAKEIEKSQKTIAEELKRLNEEKKIFYRPLVTIGIERDSKYYYFVIKNEGRGIAEKIKITCEKERAIKYDEVIRKHLNKELKLNPGEQIREILHAMSLEPTFCILQKYLPNKIDLNIAYEDEYGNTYEDGFERRLTDFD